MKKKGFTLPEVMIGILITIVIVAVSLALFVAGRSAFLRGTIAINLQQRARYSMNKIMNELRTSSPDKIALNDWNNNYYEGEMLTFQVPVITNNPKANTIFKENGDIKWGANGQEGLHFFLLVPKVALSPDYKNKLVRLTQRPSGSSGHCFLAGTPILLADGTIKLIEEIKVGDAVLSFDESCNKQQKDTVKAVMQNKTKGYYLINGHLKVTGEHPFYVKGEWKKAKDLKIGDALLKDTHQEELIADIKFVDEDVLVYNFEVNPYHTYYAGGYLVHNKEVNTSQPDEQGPFGKLHKLLPFTDYAYAGGSSKIDKYGISLIADHAKEIYFEIDGDMLSVEATFRHKSLLGIQEFTLKESILLRNKE